MIELAGIVASAGLSFLGFGFLWIGKLAGEACVAALYLLLAYTLSHRRGVRTALMTTVLPSLPLALLIVQFRDPDDSHLGSIAIVLAWLLGAVFGAFAADRERTTYRRFLACVGSTALAHAMLTLAALLSGFGNAVDMFDGKPAGTGAAAIDTLGNLLMQPMQSVLAGGPGHLSVAGQWVAYAVNSLTWGLALGTLLAMALRLKRAPAAAAAG